MKTRDVGKIKNIAYNQETSDLEITVVVTDSKFKKKILRDLALAGNIKFSNNKLIYIPIIEGEE
tara:strand:- start:716 stop:907 length:192 start_codon:yes stop_codon:yes gene_type:complete